MDLKNETIYRSNTHSRTPAPTYVNDWDDNNSVAFTLHNKDIVSEEKTFFKKLKGKKKTSENATNNLDIDADEEDSSFSYTPNGEKVSSQEEPNKNNEINNNNENNENNKNQVGQENEDLHSSVHEENVSRNYEDDDKVEIKGNFLSNVDVESSEKQVKNNGILARNMKNDRKMSYVSYVSERRMSYISEEKILKISLKARENMIIDSYNNVPSQERDNEITKSADDMVLPAYRENQLTKKNNGTKAYSDNNIKQLNPDSESEVPNTKNKNISAASVSVAISGVSGIRTEESKTEKTNKTEESKSHRRETTNSLNFKVGPEIFVSMKKGKFSKHYEIGRTLGEGYLSYLSLFSMAFFTFYLNPLDK